MNELHIVSLYHNDMNIYGDTGNILALVRRAKQHGFAPIVHEYNPGDTFPETAHLLIGGGGQDSGQSSIYEDLQKIAPQLYTLAKNGAPMLMICGMYQLFGHEFITTSDEHIKGIGVLDVVTQAESERLIGNVIAHSDDFGELVGYENHSGQTVLGKNAAPLAIVTQGAGNNQLDDTEGARFNNVIGSYLHGPLLPKNPRLTDWLIETAAHFAGLPFRPQLVDDRIADEAHARAAARPR